MQFSPDNSHLALGCWSGNAHLYRLSRAASGARTAAAGAPAPPSCTPSLSGNFVLGTPEPPPPPLEMYEIARVKRTDRVYAVGLDAHGQHMCVGGRDKTVALYEIEPDGAQHKTSLIWTAVAEDFVYAVALSADLTYCVYGGTNKAVVVLDGRTGVPDWRVALPGAVWCISMLPDSSRMAVGGELPTVNVYDLANQRDVLQLPTEMLTYDITISPDALCFTNGHFASLYGRGGTEYAWHDPPSFRAISSLIATMLTSEEQLLHSMRLILDAHPAIVNARDPDTGASLLHFVISHANQPKLFELLMSAQCLIGMQADAHGRTCLHAALEQGKWRSVQQLLEALRHKRFSIIPGSMRLVAECLEAIAVDYPLDFLQYISNMPLDPEPEVLGDIDAFGVKLDSVLLCGTTQRCPKGIWKAKLAQYSRTSHQEDAEPAPRHGSTRTLSSTRITELFKPMAHKPESGGTTAAAVANDRSIEIGYSKKAGGGLQAYRVPMENFAGLLEHGPTPVSPLQLVVDAVAKTRDYSVFDSELVEHLIKFKWKSFAKEAFYHELLMYVFDMIWVLYFNMEAAGTLEYTWSDLLGSGVEITTPQGWFFFGLVWTSIYCARKLSTEIRQLRNLGALTYLSSMWNWCDIIAIFGQLTINVLLCLRDEDGVLLIPGLTQQFGSANGLPNATARRLAERGPPLEAAAGLSGGGVGGRAAAGWPVMVDEEPGESMHHAMRWLKGRSSGRFNDDGSGVIDNEIGLLIYLQSLVCLFACLRLLYFFQGYRKLGALMHSLFTIIIDIGPLLILLIVFIIAFCSAVSIIITQHFGQGPVGGDKHDARYKQWHQFWDAMLVMINLGVYTQSDPAFMSYGTDPQFEGAEQRFMLILYQSYMLFVQLVLLNMLIAIMSESHHRVSEQSQLVALFGHAKLILEYEGDEVARQKKKAKAWEAKLKRRHRSVGGDNSLDLVRLQKEHEERHLLNLQRVCPRWLHILKPPERQRSIQTTAEEEATLRQYHELKLLIELSSRGGPEERARLMQAMRVEMSQLREDLKQDMEAAVKGRDEQLREDLKQHLATQLEAAVKGRQPG